MIINPILPVWLMTIILIIAIILIIYDKRVNEILSNTPNGELTVRQKQIVKKHRINMVIKISIFILIFLMNFRLMKPYGENIALNSNYSVLFVIDKSVSMRALDYDGNNERLEGVINDCCYIVDELSSCRFSIITFGNTAQRIIPFTNDTDMIQAELKAISTENDFYARGTSINLVKDVLEQTLKEERERKGKDTKFAIFFVTDGEITKENEKLSDFSDMREYISNGAVMGYGTASGGKMINTSFSNEPYSEFYYIYYYDNNYNKVTGVSKIDENNLKRIASDMNVDYVRMDEQGNINYKLRNIKEQIMSEQNIEDKVSSYEDTYYYLAVPLELLLIIDFVNKKRRM